MIIGDNRDAVIQNIKNAAERGEFYSKVEINDPVLTPAESKEITSTYVENRKHLSFKVTSAAAILLARCATSILNRDTEIKGIEKIPKDLGGVLITSNHFSPLENTVVRHLLHKMGRKDLGIISQTTNFAMTGIVGFLMRYANTIPLSMDPHYLARDFLSILQEKLVDKKQAILLYPEQEMWFHYRKPRPPKSGAYFYAAKLGVPILSCFVEIVDTDKEDAEGFRKVRHVLHVLGVLYPDKERSVRENTEFLAATDYAMKCACYETVYKKKLTYDFETEDIAGWKGTL